MASSLRHLVAPRNEHFLHFPTVPWPVPLKHTRLYLVETKSRHKIELSWIDGVHGALLTMGANGFRLGHARDDAKG